MLGSWQSSKLFYLPTVLNVIAFGIAQKVQHEKDLLFNVGLFVLPSLDYEHKGAFPQRG